LAHNRAKREFMTDEDRQKRRQVWREYYQKNRDDYRVAARMRYIPRSQMTEAELEHRKAIDRKSKLKHRDKILAKKHEDYWLNHETMLKKHRESYRRHRDKILPKIRQERKLMTEADRERERATKRKYRDKNRDRMNAYSRDYYNRPDVKERYAPRIRAYNQRPEVPGGGTGINGGSSGSGGSGAGAVSGIHGQGGNSLGPPFPPYRLWLWRQ
jgi:hypothetical protein